jgi:hypothetical protein
MRYMPLLTDESGSKRGSVSRIFAWLHAASGQQPLKLSCLETASRLAAGSGFGADVLRLREGTGVHVRRSNAQRRRDPTRAIFGIEAGIQGSRKWQFLAFV